MRKLASSDAFWYMLFDPVRQSLGYMTYVSTIVVAQILITNIAMLKSRYIFYGSRQKLTGSDTTRGSTAKKQQQTNDVICFLNLVETVASQGKWK